MRIGFLRFGLSRFGSLTGFAVFGAALSAGNGFAQAPFGDLQAKPATAKSAAVSYLFPEQVTVAAGKATKVDLHFKVADGLHVNSHSPHTEDLIPTTLKFPDGGAVQLAKVDFPAGADFSLASDPTDKRIPGDRLSVYTGEFVVHAELVASNGDHLVTATLRYQACSNSACMPPHSIPVVIDVIGR